MKIKLLRACIAFASLSLSNVAHANDPDMAGTAVFCQPKRVTQLTDVVAPRPETMLSWYFYVKKDQRFCWSAGDDPNACENPSAFQRFRPNAPDGMKMDQDYYYGIDDQWGQLKVRRNGTQYYDIDSKFKTHGSCRKIKDLD